MSVKPIDSVSSGGGALVETAIGGGIVDEGAAGLDVGTKGPAFVNANGGS